MYGLDRLSVLDLDSGIAHAATTDRVLVSIFLDGGADSLSMLFPAATAALLPVPPDARAAAVRRVAFSEDGRLRWHPSLGLARPAARRGQGQRDPGDRLHEPGQVALHLAPLLGGRRDERGARDRLARALPRPGRIADNPLQGLSLDNRLQPALATAKVPVASIDGPDRYTFARARGRKPRSSRDARRGR